MKRTADIIGLPVFSLTDGAEIGRIKQLVVRPDAGRVELFVVENEWDSIGVHVLPYPQTIGVGEFAVTVESKEAIQELTAVEGARELVLLGYKIIGTRVLSRKGQLVGHIEEYWINEETGAVTACSFKDAKDPAVIRYFSDDNIMTFGRDVLVIHAEENITAELTEPTVEAAAGQQATTASAEVTEAQQEAAASVEVTEAQQEPAATAETAEVEQNTTTSSEAAELPVGPYAYLVGKQLREDLRNDAGDVLAAAGSPITHELIERIKAESPTLFMKLNRLAVENR